jgi:predicted Zn-dependent peptidase
VADFYRRYLSPERARAVFVHAGSSRGSAEVAGQWPVGGRASDEPPPPTLDELRSWMRPPGIAEAKRVILDNGLEVVVLPRPGAQFHSVVVAYHGGQGDEEVAGAAIASLWAKERFHVSAGVWGVEYADQTREDLTFESLRATGSDLGNTFEQLRREDEFRIFWPPPQFSNRIEAFEREDRSTKERFERRVRETFFGPHPYGRWVTTSLLRAVRPSDVYGFVDTIRRPGNGLVVVVGDVDTSEAIRLATAAFGQTPPPTMRTLSTPPPLEHAAAKPGQRLVIEDRPSSPSVRMQLLCSLPPAQEGSLGVESVFSQALAGSLHDELREEAAASYSVRGWIEALRGGTTVLVLDGDVEVARLPVAVQALRRFFEDPIARVFDDDRLARARADAARLLNLSLGATEPLAMRVVSAWNLGRPIEEIDRYPEVVAATSREDMARLGERCRANWVLGLLGDQSRIQDGLVGWSP